MKPNPRSYVCIQSWHLWGLVTLAAGLVLGGVSARAAIFDIADGDVAGLITAINTANDNGVADTINLSSGGTYTLTAVDNNAGALDGDNGLPEIITDITINGNDAVIERDSDESFRILMLGSPAELTLNDLTVRGGIATGTLQYGGGILNRGATMVLNNIIVSGNVGNGGGIFTISAIATITNSTISGNRSNTAAGGIHSVQSMMTLNNSTVSGNSASGNSGSIGGGIFTESGLLVLNNSTVSGNSCDRPSQPCLGGGILADGPTTLNNSTITGNSAGLGGGIFVDSGVTLTNTIVADNPSGEDCGRPRRILSLGHNLDSDGTCGLSDPTDLPNIVPLLGPLQDNGGPTDTHALLFSSPAIDAIPISDCTDVDGNPITTDQRGVFRPQGAACDIGAYELVDVDGDGIPDDEDVCSGTVIPESVPTRRLGVNRFALTATGNGIDFDTTAPRGGGRGPQKSFTMEDTAGCSCEQIIEVLGLGKGHSKFGCSISAMEDFISGLVQ